jgi:hypothetical protein
MHRLTVDYTRYLRSPVVEVALFASERAERRRHSTGEW